MTRPASPCRRSATAWSRGAPAPGCELAPLDRAATRRLLADRFPDLDPDAVERIWAASAGLPFTVLEMARSQAAGGSDGVLPALPPPVLRTFQRVALLGSKFSTDELVAVSGVGGGRGLPAPRGGAGRPAGPAVRRRVLLPAQPGPGVAGPAAAAARRVRGPPRGGRAARRARGAAGPGGAPLPRRRAALAGGALRAARGRDRRCARRLPGRPGPRRRGPRARRSRGAAAPAGPARGPADGDRRPRRRWRPTGRRSR